MVIFGILDSNYKKKFNWAGCFFVIIKKKKLSQQPTANSQQPTAINKSIPKKKLSKPHHFIDIRALK